MKIAARKMWLYISALQISGHPCNEWTSIVRQTNFSFWHMDGVLEYATILHDVHVPN